MLNSMNSWEAPWGAKAALQSFGLLGSRSRWEKRLHGVRPSPAQPAGRLDLRPPPGAQDRRTGTWDSTWASQPARRWGVRMRLPRGKVGQTPPLTWPSPLSYPGRLLARAQSGCALQPTWRCRERVGAGPVRERLAPTRIYRFSSRRRTPLRNRAGKREPRTEEHPGAGLEVNGGGNDFNSLTLARGWVHYHAF